MPSSIISPFPVFNDLDGTPLENGYIYIGQSNLNPETAPVNVFWDAARTIPAAQPIRTIGGFPSRNGSPSNVYVENDTYSITVRNSRRVFVYSAFDQTDAPSSVFDISTQVITATAGQTTFTLTTFTYLPGTDTLQVYRNGLRLTSGTDYLESSTSVVTMTSPAAAGDEFLFQGGAVITGDTTSGTSVAFTQAGTGAITRNIQEKARESVSVKDFGAVGTGLVDDTAAIQAAIDSLGNGGEVVFPQGTYLHTGIRIDGSSGGRSNISLKGSGAGSKLYLAASNTNNSIRAAGGVGFSIENLKIEGNLSRGGSAVTPPTKGFWTPSTAYLVNDTVEVSSSDGQTTTVAASNLVYRCILGYTSSATFAADKASYWVLTSNPNFNTVDLSYATRNGIYLDGVAGATVSGCWILDHVYAGINIGTGPVQAANAGPGSDYVSVQKNNIYGNGNGIAGGKQRYANIDGNTIRDNSFYQIVVDVLSSSVSVAGNQIKGGSSHGIYFYNSTVASVSGNTIAGCAGVGILFDNATVTSAIVGNVVTSCLQGIRVYNSTVNTISSNSTTSCTQYGISIDTASQFSVVANVCNANGFDGIRLTLCSAFTLQGNSLTTNLGQGGIYITGSSLGTVVGNMALNNNNAATPSADGAGIRIVDSTTITVTANECFDSRAGAAKTQKYGVRSTGTSNVVLLSANNLSGNGTGTFLLSGANNRVAPDVSNVTAASVPANFTATHYATFVQSDGTIVYIPARLGAW